MKNANINRRRHTEYAQQECLQILEVYNRYGAKLQHPIIIYISYDNKCC